MPSCKYNICNYVKQYYQHIIIVLAHGIFSITTDNNNLHKKSAKGDTSLLNMSPFDQFLFLFCTFTFLLNVIDIFITIYYNI